METDAQVRTQEPLTEADWRSVAKLYQDRWNGRRLSDEENRLIVRAVTQDRSRARKLSYQCIENRKQ